MTGAGIMLVALAVEAVIGWPRPLYKVIGHPVTWLGHLISGLDVWLNLPGAEDRDRRFGGIATAFAIIAVAVGIGAIIQWLAPEGWLGTVILGVVAWPLIAARSLYDHVAAVGKPLASGDLAKARRAVSMIVGRDPSKLDEAGISRAALESLAENASDGVFAPLFWGALLGLPGIAAYKAINTLDSMIGHRTPKYEAFGWASARIDDLVNLVPARLTGLLFAVVSSVPRAALLCMFRDARHHRSPNAGWPEAAMAAALGVRLSGPRAYADRIADEPWVNGGARDPQAGDIKSGLVLFRNAVCLGAILLAIVWLA